jgi:hypothetical protein
MKSNNCQACNFAIHGVKTRQAIKHTCGRSDLEIHAYVEEEKERRKYGGLALLKELQVCTHEQGTRLKELGVIQGHSLWKHLHLPETTYRVENQIIYTGDMVYLDIGDGSDAFGLPELGIMIGPYAEYLQTDAGFMVRVPKKYFPHPMIQDNANYFVILSNLSEAEARAEMLINLISNGVLDINLVNQRLLSGKKLFR